MNDISPVAVTGATGVLGAFVARDLAERGIAQRLPVRTPQKGPAASGHRRAYASRASFGAPDWQVDAWVSTYTAIASGVMAPVSADVERVTGDRPMTLADYLASTGRSRSPWATARMIRATSRRRTTPTARPRWPATAERWPATPSTSSTRSTCWVRRSAISRATGWAAPPSAAARRRPCRKASSARSLDRAPAAGPASGPRAPRASRARASAHRHA